MGMVDSRCLSIASRIDRGGVWNIEGIGKPVVEGRGNLLRFIAEPGGRARVGFQHCIGQGVITPRILGLYEQRERLLGKTSSSSSKKIRLPWFLSRPSAQQIEAE